MTVLAPRPSARLALLATALVPAAALATYAASPYVALYNISQALRSHDLAALQKSIDWDGVRSGIKQEVEASLSDQGAVPPHGMPGALAPRAMTVKAVATIGPSQADDLPDFGDSFATSAVNQSVDQGFTPEALSALIGGVPGSATSRLGFFAQARRAISWAFFTGPGHFVAMVKPGGSTGSAVRVSMVFSRSGWRVTRVWLPPDMLEQHPQERT